MTILIEKLGLFHILWFQPVSNELLPLHILMVLDRKYCDREREELPWWKPISISPHCLIQMSSIVVRRGPEIIKRRRSLNTEFDNCSILFRVYSWACSVGTRETLTSHIAVRSDRFQCVIVTSLWLLLTPKAAKPNGPWNWAPHARLP